MSITTLLLIGPVQTLAQNVVYALPARKVRVQSDVAVEVSNTTNSGFVTLTGANTVGVETSAQFIRSTTGDAVVSVKV